MNTIISALPATLCILSTGHRTAQVDQSQIVEVIDKLVASGRAGGMQRVIGSASGSASLIGGFVGEKHSLQFDFISDREAPIVLCKEAYGNDYELNVDVVSDGKKVTLTQNEYRARFTGKKGKKYSIKLTNVGAATFAGMAILQSGQGPKLPLNACSKAAKVMAKSADNALKDKFQVTPDSVSLLGYLIPSKGIASRPTPKWTDWTVLATSSGGAGTISMSVLDSSLSIIQQDNGEAVDCVSVFHQVVSSGKVHVQNIGSKSVFVLSMILQK